VPTVGSNPLGITAGPDGNLWFTEEIGDKIGRITTAGAITEFPVPAAGSMPFYITAGPDGNLWFTELYGDKIGRITTAGAITEFPVPTAGSMPQGITTSPDGKIWFTELSSNMIGYVTSLVTSSPSPPTLISPFDGETNVALNPAFSWNASAGADSYELQVATNVNFTNIVVDQSGITATSYTPASPLSNDATYYWQVNATNISGTSWSNVWSFHTQQIYGNLFIGVRGKLDPDLDEDGIDDTDANNGEVVLGTTGGANGKKTLFIRPEQHMGGNLYVYWEDFYNILFPEHPKPGFAKIDPLWNAGIEVVVIGPTCPTPCACDSNGLPTGSCPTPCHHYPPFDCFNYDPSADPKHPSCDILDVVNKLPDSYYGSSPYKGHTFFKEVVISENPLVVKPYWWWDTKGYTPNNPNTPQYQTYGYFIPELYSFPLEKYFKEGAYTSISQGISPYTTNCYNANPPCDISSFSSPVNLPPDVDTVEFNPITFNINNGQITEMDTAHIPAKGYTREDVLRRTTIHEIGHALLNASNDDHCENPQCIMYEAVTDWELHDFGSYDVSGAPKCFHVSGGAKDIRQRIHNTQHLPAPPPPPPSGPPAIDSVSPTTVKALCTLTVNGSNFGATQGTSSIKLWNPKHTKAKVVAAQSVQRWSLTQITFTVPKFGTTYPAAGKKKDVQVVVPGMSTGNCPVGNCSRIYIVAPGTCP
jgi:hypothetical protein